GLWRPCRGGPAQGCARVGLAAGGVRLVRLEGHGDLQRPPRPRDPEREPGRDLAELALAGRIGVPLRGRCHPAAAWPGLPWRGLPWPGRYRSAPRSPGRVAGVAGGGRGRILGGIAGFLKGVLPGVLSGQRKTPAEGRGFWGKAPGDDLLL